MMTINNWGTARHPAFAFRAPETFNPSITGTVTFPDGSVKAITTSPIATVADRIVTTQSGNRYFLGTPDPAFLAWCRDHYGADTDPLSRLNA